MLVLCAGCARHVRVEEPHCPFCEHVRALPNRSGTRATSAAVVAGTLMLGALGCREPAAVYGGPPPVDPADLPPEPSPTSVDVEPAPPAPVPSGTSTAQPPDDEVDPPDGIRAGTLYGAPPPDADLE